jgi:hypothetical protein
MDEQESSEEPSNVPSDDEMAVDTEETDDSTSTTVTTSSKTSTATVQSFALPPTPSSSSSSSTSNNIKVTPSNVEDERNSMPPPSTATKSSKSGPNGGHNGENDNPLGSPGFTKKCTPQRITSAQILLMLKSQPKDLLAATKAQGGDLKDVESWLEESEAPPNLKATVQNFIYQSKNGRGETTDSSSTLSPSNQSQNVTATEANGSNANWQLLHQNNSTSSLEDAGCNCKKSKCLKL